MNSEALNLPWQLQVSLACGYAGYFIANAGRRSHHQPTDIAFATLVYGVFSGAFYLILLPVVHEIWAAAASLLFSLILGAVWRAFGRNAMYLCLRKIRVSYSNDDPSALVTLTETTTHDLTQIAVLLNDGTWLRCDDAAAFENAPHGPCLLGPSGDVAMYLTHIDKKGRRSRATETVSDPKIGHRITYVPANQIARISLRYAKRS